jgi:hypothetical protein
LLGVRLRQSTPQSFGTARSEDCPGLLLDEAVFTILGDVEIAPRLARRQIALRRHLESVE